MSDEITKWLKELGLGAYAKVFAESAIDLDVLPHLNDDDLKELGLPLGHRRKLQTAARALVDTQHAVQDPKPPNIDVHAQSGGDAERRQLTVLFSDLVGSTELSQRFDPEDLREINRAYQDACKAAIERYEGYVARYMGDGVLAYFGYPQAHEDDPERAVLAGLGLIEDIKALNARTGDEYGAELAVRVGVATGPVVVGDLIGEGASQESAVVGETPNIAARLQSLANPNTVVVASNTHQLTAGQFRFGDLGKRRLKGIAQPVQAWQVLGEGGIESRFEATRGRQLTPLVGREEEMSLLAERWADARKGTGQVVLISGEAGIGKSRICEALQVRIAGQSVTRVRYQCSPHHTHSVLYPIINQLERAARIEAQCNAEEKLERLEDLLRESSGTVEEDVPLLATLLSIPLAGRYAPLGINAHELKKHTFEAVLRQLDGLCARRPVLVVFEDLHWVDPSTAELLNRLVERVIALPALVLITFRPELSWSWADQKHITFLTLGRIREQERRGMLNAVVGLGSLPERLLNEIVEKTDGVPLYIEEMGRSVLETQREAGARTLNDSEIEIPATLQDSLMARLDRLRFGKQIAQTGAAIGREFTEDLLKSVCDLDLDIVDHALKELVKTGLLFNRGSGTGKHYVFEHALIQDAAYNSLLRANRRLLHRRIAEELSVRSPEKPSLLAYHWELAEDFEQAIECRLDAAKQASDLYALPESITQYVLALDILDELPQTKEITRRHLNTVVAVVRSVGLTGSSSFQDEDQRERAVRHLDKAIETATGAGDFSSLARLEAYKGGTWLDEAYLAQAVKDAEASGDKSVQAEVGSRYAGFLGRVGRLEDSYVHADRTIELYGELGELALQGMALAGEGRCFSARSGRLDDSLRCAARVREIAKETGDRHLNAWKVMESEPLMYKGLWEEAIQVSREDLPVAFESGDWLVVLFASAWAAIACIKLGRLEEAQQFLGEALSAVEERVGLDYPRAYIQSVAALMQKVSGDIDKARATARAAVEMAESGGYLVEQGAANRVLGEVYAAGGDREEADNAFRRSIEQLSNIQSRSELAQTLLAYGKFKREKHVADGERLLNQALQMFQAMDATGWIHETQRALES